MMTKKSVTLYSSSQATRGETALAANRLCQACGMCCTGVLFSHITLDKEDRVRAKRAGIKMRKVSADKTVAPLPCTQFKNGACSVYDLRPKKCQSYYCGLQKKVMNGEVAAERAEEVIRTTKGEAEWLLAQGRKLTGVDALNLREFLYTLHKQAGKTLAEKGLSKGDRELILRAFEFAKMVDRYFKNTELLTRFGDLVQTMERSKGPEK